jgi:YEATS domain-containing protein 4
MAPPAANKRVKNKRISRNISTVNITFICCAYADFAVIGSEAWLLPPIGHPDRPKNVPEDHTKRWTVYVRSPEGDPDITAWLSKVQFKIFNTYENPLRTCENPPFEVTETGWGGFSIDIRLHFQPISGEKAQYRQHFLQLEKYGDEKMQAEQDKTGCVRAESLEVVQFNEPTEALWDALTSEDQWNYLIPAGKGGSKKLSLNASGRMKRGLPNGERSAQLPEKGAEDVQFSQDQEQALVDLMKSKVNEIDKLFERETKNREVIEKRLKDLRAEMGHEAAQLAAQQASGDRSRRR